MRGLGQPTPVNNPHTPFDVARIYLKFLDSHANMTPPIAAIESLIQLLISTPAATFSETVTLIRNADMALRESRPNDFALTAGTELFQRYMSSTLQRHRSARPTSDFSVLRQEIISKSQDFVKHARKGMSESRHIQQ